MLEIKVRPGWTPLGKLSSRGQGADFRRVVMLRNGAVPTKQNLSTAHEFVVC